MKNNNLFLAAFIVSILTSTSLSADSKKGLLDFGSLIEGPVKDKNGKVVVDKSGNTKTYKLSDKDVEKQVREKIEPMLALRKIKNMEITKDKVIIEIVEDDDSPFYTMEILRNTGLSTTDQIISEQRSTTSEKTDNVIEHDREIQQKYKEIVNTLGNPIKTDDKEENSGKNKKAETPAPKKRESIFSSQNRNQ